MQRPASRLNMSVGRVGCLGKTVADLPNRGAVIEGAVDSNFDAAASRRVFRSGYRCSRSAVTSSMYFSRAIRKWSWPEADARRPNNLIESGRVSPVCC